MLTCKHNSKFPSQLIFDLITCGLYNHKDMNYFAFHSISSCSAGSQLLGFPDLEAKMKHHVSVCSKVPSVWCSEVGLLHLAALLLFLGYASFSPCRAGISVAGSAERWALHSAGSPLRYVLTATAQGTHLLNGQRQVDETAHAKHRNQ